MRKPSWWFWEGLLGKGDMRPSPGSTAMQRPRGHKAFGAGEDRRGGRCGRAQGVRVREGGQWPGPRRPVVRTKPEVYAQSRGSP